MSEKTKKGFHIHEYLIVIFMLLLACVLTYVIPAGDLRGGKRKSGDLSDF